MQKIVPNQDKIMGEFRDDTEETIVDLVEKVLEKEPHKENGEEVEVRKRKIGEEEEEETNSGAMMRNSYLKM